MTAWIHAHRMQAGAGLLLASLAIWVPFLFGWGRGQPPAGAILITPPTPVAFATPAHPAGAPARAPAPAARTPLPRAVSTAVSRSLTVYATGAIQRPGVYILTDTARVADLLTLAGGPAGDADLDRVNLAARLQDGEQVVFPSHGTPGAAAPAGAPAPAAAPAAAGKTLDGPVNINTADAVRLASLPGIGPTLAGRIVAYRAAHGPFARIEVIQDVPGIGPKLFERIRAALTVGP